MANNVTINTELENLKNFWKDKRVIITGGSKGLGEALALTLESLEAKIIIIARNSDRVASVASFSDNINGITADVANKNDIYKISGQALAILGGVDVLINNASSLGTLPMKSLIDTECEDLVDTFETNFFGPFRLIKAFLGPMILQGNGLILNVSSDASISAYPTWGSYSTSKAALDHLSRIWAQELSTKNIKFLSVDPGDMLTDMHMDAIPDANPDELFKPEDVATLLSKFLSIKNFEKIRYSADEWRSKI